MYLKIRWRRLENVQTPSQKRKACTKPFKADKCIQIEHGPKNGAFKYLKLIALIVSTNLKLKKDKS